MKNLLEAFESNPDDFSTLLAYNKEISHLPKALSDSFFSKLRKELEKKNIEIWNCNTKYNPIWFELDKTQSDNDIKEWFKVDIDNYKVYFSYMIYEQNIKGFNIKNKSGCL